MIGHVLAGDTVREEQRREIHRLLKNCLPSRTTGLGQCFRAEFPADHHLHCFANRVVRVSE